MQLINKSKKTKKYRSTIQHEQHRGYQDNTIIYLPQSIRSNKRIQELEIDRNWDQLFSELLVERARSNVWAKSRLFVVFLVVEGLVTVGPWSYCFKNEAFILHLLRKCYYGFYTSQCLTDRDLFGLAI